MFKYDDIISTLTLVNILAKDLNYGNLKETENSVIAVSENYNFLFTKIATVKNFYKKVFLKIKMNFLNFLQLELFKNKVQKILLKYFILIASLYKNLQIYLQKLVLYNQIFKNEYG